MIVQIPQKHDGALQNRSEKEDKDAPSTIGDIAEDISISEVSFSIDMLHDIDSKEEEVSVSVIDDVVNKASLSNIIIDINNSQKSLTAKINNNDGNYNNKFHEKSRESQERGSQAQAQTHSSSRVQAQAQAQLLSHMANNRRAGLLKASILMNPKSTDIMNLSEHSQSSVGREGGTGAVYSQKTTLARNQSLGSTSNSSSVSFPRMHKPSRITKINSKRNVFATDDFNNGNSNILSWQNSILSASTSSWNTTISRAESGSTNSHNCPTDQPKTQLPLSRSLSRSKSAGKLVGDAPKMARKCSRSPTRKSAASIEPGSISTSLSPARKHKDGVTSTLRQHRGDVGAPSSNNTCPSQEKRNLMSLKMSRTNSIRNLCAGNYKSLAAGSTSVKLLGTSKSQNLLNRNADAGVNNCICQDSLPIRNSGSEGNLPNPSSMHQIIHMDSMEQISRTAGVTTSKAKKLRSRACSTDGSISISVNIRSSLMSLQRQRGRTTNRTTAGTADTNIRSRSCDGMPRRNYSSTTAKVRKLVDYSCAKKQHENSVDEPLLSMNGSSHSAATMPSPSLKSKVTDFCEYRKNEKVLTTAEVMETRTCRHRVSTAHKRSQSYDASIPHSSNMTNLIDAGHCGPGECGGGPRQVKSSGLGRSLSTDASALPSKLVELIEYVRAKKQQHNEVPPQKEMSVKQIAVNSGSGLGSGSGSLVPRRCGGHQAYQDPTTRCSLSSDVNSTLPEKLTELINYAKAINQEEQKKHDRGDKDGGKQDINTTTRTRSRGSPFRSYSNDGIPMSRGLRSMSKLIDYSAHKGGEGRLDSKHCGQHDAVSNVGQQHPEGGSLRRRRGVRTTRGCPTRSQSSDGTLLSMHRKLIDYSGRESGLNEQFEPSPKRGLQVAPRTTRGCPNRSHSSDGTLLSMRRKLTDYSTQKPGPNEKFKPLPRPGQEAEPRTIRGCPNRSHSSDGTLLSMRRKLIDYSAEKTGPNKHFQSSLRHGLEVVPLQGAPLPSQQRCFPGRRTAPNRSFSSDDTRLSSIITIDHTKNPDLRNSENFGTARRRKRYQRHQQQQNEQVAPMTSISLSKMRESLKQKQQIQQQQAAKPVALISTNSAPRDFGKSVGLLGDRDRTNTTNTEWKQEQQMQLATQKTLKQQTMLQQQEGNNKMPGRRRSIEFKACSNGQSKKIYEIITDSDEDDILSIYDDNSETQQRMDSNLSLLEGLTL